ncbi:hypothetical protein AB0L10_00215 [Streptomyces flaveolus]|uniref:hypothetical protein n=1 Tax=Streptomyces flaveolus TaxID=67297 RepID=UPI0034139742
MGPARGALPARAGNVAGLVRELLSGAVPPAAGRPSVAPTDAPCAGGPSPAASSPGQGHDPGQLRT